MNTRICFGAALLAVAAFACRTPDHPNSLVVPPGDGQDVRSRSSTYLARSWCVDEGIWHTEIYRLHAGEPTAMVARIERAQPIRWSPVREELLLMRMACADDDQRHALVDVERTPRLDLCESIGWMNPLGTRWSTLREWSTQDVLEFDDAHAHIRVLRASSPTPQEVITWKNIE